MSRIKDLRLGFRHIREGFRYLWKHPRLWVYAFIPFLLSLLVFGVGVSIFADHFGTIHTYFTNWIGSLQLSETPNFLWKTANLFLWLIDQIIGIFIFLIGLLFISIFTYLVQMLIAAPFNDILSEKVETIEGGIPPPALSINQWIRGMLRTLLNEGKKALFLLMVPLLLLLITLLPFIGALFYTVAVTLFGIWDVGFNFVDLSLGRRQGSFKERLQFGKKHYWALTGLGTIFLIPFAPLFLQAPLVVGGTLLYLKLKDDLR